MDCVSGTVEMNPASVGFYVCGEIDRLYSEENCIKLKWECNMVK